MSTWKDEDIYSAWMNGRGAGPAAKRSYDVAGDGSRRSTWSKGESAGRYTYSRQDGTSPSSSSYQYRPNPSFNKGDRYFSTATAAAVPTTHHADHEKSQGGGYSTGGSNNSYHLTSSTTTSSQPNTGTFRPEADRQVTDAHSEDQANAVADALGVLSLKTRRTEFQREHVSNVHERAHSVGGLHEGPVVIKQSEEMVHESFGGPVILIEEEDHLHAEMNVDTEEEGAISAEPPAFQPPPLPPPVSNQGALESLKSRLKAKHSMMAASGGRSSPSNDIADLSMSSFDRKTAMADGTISESPTSQDNPRLDDKGLQASDILTVSPAEFMAVLNEEEGVNGQAGSIVEAKSENGPEPMDVDAMNSTTNVSGADAGDSAPPTGSKKKKGRRQKPKNGGTPGAGKTPSSSAPVGGSSHAATAGSERLSSRQPVTLDLEDDDHAELLQCGMLLKSRIKRNQLRANILQLVGEYEKLLSVEQDLQKKLGRLLTNAGIQTKRTQQFDRWIRTMPLSCDMSCPGSCAETPSCCNITPKMEVDPDESSNASSMRGPSPSKRRRKMPQE